MSVIWDGSYISNTTWKVNGVTQSGSVFSFEWGDMISFVRTSGRTQTFETIECYDSDNNLLDTISAWSNDFDISNVSDKEVPQGTAKIVVGYLEDNSWNNTDVYVGKIYYELSTLAGTIWQFKASGITADDAKLNGNVALNINFVSNNNNYTSIKTNSYHANDEYEISYGNTIVYGQDYEGIDYSFDGEWIDEGYRTISITDGTDVTNSNLIYWLETFAVQQPVPTYKTFDLSTLQLADGTHTIQVKARATGYKDSNFSNSVSYEVQSVLPYLTFESDDGSNFTLGTDAEYMGVYMQDVFATDGTLEYSLDGTTWQTFNPLSTVTSTNGKIYMRGTGNTYLSTWSSCFLEGTMITLADGTQKKVEDITYNDRLKVWNFDTGTYDTADICWLTKSGLKNYHYYKLTFSDGTILKTTGINSNHKVYNVDERYFKGVNKTEIGDRVFTENGIVTVVNKEYIEEEAPYYNLITSQTFCCFANGVLTSDRYGNIYPIDSNMMFVKNGRQVRPYSEFEAVGIDRYWYDNLRLGENTETLEETEKYISRLERQMKAR